MNNSKSSTSTSIVNPVKTIIVHYHLFKNAGTSVDRILKQNFGSAWREIEFQTNSQKSNAEDVGQWLLNNLDISAFSSHTAMFPLLSLEGISIIPIVFLRHPIDRLWSAYKFERKHEEILNESIRVAREHDFAGYLNHHLDRPQHRSCRNFQTHRLSWLSSKSDSTELSRAMEGLDSLPLVGIVEQFDLSMKYYSQAIARAYPSFQFNPVHENITAPKNLSPAEKLKDAMDNLDPATYERLLEANTDDLQLYQAAKSKLLARSTDSLRDKTIF